MSASPAARVIIDASEHNSDLLYVSGFLAGDPFPYVSVGDTSYLILSDLEYGRGKKEASVDHVVSYSELEKEIKGEDENKRPGLMDVVLHFLEKQGVDEVTVPARFPVIHADRMRASGLEVKVQKDPFIAQRVRKSDKELDLIAQCQRDTEQTMLAVIAEIDRSEERDGHLYLDGEVLTAETLKRFIRRRLLDLDYRVASPIVASGDKGCDPHDTGSGEILPNESIVIDIFPQHLEHRYWGDMTRTLIKGTPSPEMVKIHAAVVAAKARAIELIRPGINGAEVHKRVQQSLIDDGFETASKNGVWHGFFHGTGHGVGLDIHEGPRVGMVGNVLEEGMVITVEPGLYYPGVGGCRVEDMVVVTADGCRNLNSAAEHLVTSEYA